MHLEANATLDPAEDGRAGADLDVVRMSAETKYGKSLARLRKA